MTHSTYDIKALAWTAARNQKSLTIWIFYTKCKQTADSQIINKQIIGQIRLLFCSHLPAEQRDQDQRYLSDKD